MTMAKPLPNKFVLTVSCPEANGIVRAVSDFLYQRGVVAEYVDYYNNVRPHQGVGNVPLGDWHPTTEGALVCDERMNGLLKSLRRAA